MCGCKKREHCGLMSFWGRGEKAPQYFSNKMTADGENWAYDANTACD